MDQNLLPFQADQPPVTRDYLPAAYLYPYEVYRRAPLFTVRTIVEMLSDPTIRFGLWLIKGPILAKSRFYIKCNQPEVKQWLVDNVSRFWRNASIRALKALEWGASCCEILWKMDETKGTVDFDDLKYLHFLDCRALTVNGMLVGANIRNNRGYGSQGVAKLKLLTPKVFWHVHSREVHPWYGESRLKGAYLPWLEAWTDGGYRDARRLFFHKYAFQGGGGYYPPGPQKVEIGPGQYEIRQAKDMMREILDKMKTGGSWAMPNTTDAAGTRQWEVIPPTVQPIPESLMELGNLLSDEELKGMGIPPEMARPEATGPMGGGNGRSIAQEAFFSILQEEVNRLIGDADKFVFKIGSKMNFGDDQYEIIPFSLLDIPASEAPPAMSPTSDGKPSLVADEPEPGSQLALQIGLKRKVA
jgi:hypothetical protein